MVILSLNGHLVISNATCLDDAIPGMKFHRKWYYNMDSQFTVVLLEVDQIETVYRCSAGPEWLNHGGSYIDFGAPAQSKEDEKAQIARFLGFCSILW